MPMRLGTEAEDAPLIENGRKCLEMFRASAEKIPVHPDHVAEADLATSSEMVFQTVTAVMQVALNEAGETYGLHGSAQVAFQCGHAIGGLFGQQDLETARMMIRILQDGLIDGMNASQQAMTPQGRA